MASDIGDDILDVRDLIERFEELEAERDEYGADAEDEDSSGDPEGWALTYPEDAAELALLAELLDDLKGYGGDHQWKGDGYPVMLIRDSYFKEYAMELADNIGAIDHNAGWPANCIDWDQAARELRTDYSEVDIDGHTYYYR